MNRYAHCHFCDDIRYELGNKTSLIGLYGGEMYVSSIPSVIPKLCFFVLFATGIDNPVKALSMRISDKEQVLMEQELSSDELRSAYEQATERGTEDDPIRQFTVGMNLIASPFVISKESVVTVSVIADGEEMIAGRLRVKQAKEGQVQG